MHGRHEFCKNLSATEGEKERRFVSSEAGSMPKNDHNKTVGSCMFEEIRRGIFERRKGGVSEWNRR